MDRSVALLRELRLLHVLRGLHADRRVRSLVRVEVLRGRGEIEGQRVQRRGSRRRGSVRHSLSPPQHVRQTRHAVLETLQRVQHAQRVFPLGNPRLDLAQRRWRGILQFRRQSPRPRRGVTRRVRRHRGRVRSRFRSTAAGSVLRVVLRKRHVRTQSGHHFALLVREASVVGTQVFLRHSVLLISRGASRGLLRGRADRVLPIDSWRGCGWIFAGQFRVNVQPVRLTTIDRADRVLPITWRDCGWTFANQFRVKSIRLTIDRGSSRWFLRTTSKAVAAERCRRRARNVTRGVPLLRGTRRDGVLTIGVRGHVGTSRWRNRSRAARDSCSATLPVIVAVVITLVNKTTANVSPGGSQASTVFVVAIGEQK